MTQPNRPLANLGGAFSFVTPKLLPEPPPKPQSPPSPLTTPSLESLLAQAKSQSVAPTVPPPKLAPDDGTSPTTVYGLADRLESLTREATAVSLAPDASEVKMRAGLWVKRALQAGAFADARFRTLRTHLEGLTGTAFWWNKFCAWLEEEHGEDQHGLDAAWRKDSGIVAHVAKKLRAIMDGTPAAAVAQAEPIKGRRDMLDEPIAFTDDQRQLFQRIAELIRSRPQAFEAAGQWLDAGACLPKTQERIKQTRTCWLFDARDRRQEARSKDKDAGRAYPVPPQGRTLAVSRNILAGRIRANRNRAASDPTHYEIVDAAARAFVSKPPNYDAMRPDLAKRQARQVLLVAWILTDTADLRTTPGITSLQDWAWQQTDWELPAAQLEFLVAADDGQHRPIPRLYARITVLDDHFAEWVKLAGDALRASMLAAPTVPVDGVAQAVPPAEQGEATGPTTPKPSQSTPAEPKATMSKEAMAIAALMDHPDWTDIQIADTAGCNRTSLYAMTKYMASRKLLKEHGKTLMLGGSKYPDSNMETWDNKRNQRNDNDD